MMKRVVALLLVVVLCLGCFGAAGADDCKDCKKSHEHHDHWFEEIFFGEQYKENDRCKNLIYLENASYVCIDQHACNVSSEKDKQFNSLKNFKLAGYPDSLEEIQCPGGWTHRMYTHIGWINTEPYKPKPSKSKVEWSEEKWQWRRKILMATVEKVFNFTPLIPDWLEFRNGYSKRCEHFSGLIYYIHLLGDHMEMESATDFSSMYNEHNPYLLRLADKDAERMGDTFDGKKAIIPALIYHMDALFDKENNHTYALLREELIKINRKASPLCFRSELTPEQFSKYKEYVNQTHQKLKQFMPSLLEEQTYFKKAFPNKGKS